MPNTPRFALSVGSRDRTDKHDVRGLDRIRSAPPRLRLPTAVCMGVQDLCHEVVAGTSYLDRGAKRLSPMHFKRFKRET